MWRLGWVSPVLGGDLNGSTLDVGRTRTFLLPGQTRATRSILRIDPTWLLTAGDDDDSINDSRMTPLPVYYVSLREVAPPFDTPSSSAFRGSRVAVYTSRATQAENSIEPSYYHTALDPDGTAVFKPNATGLVIRVVSIASNGTSATVSICRASGEREAQGGASCSDGRDNDCDGLVAAEATITAASITEITTTGTAAAKSDSVAAVSKTVATAAAVAATPPGPPAPPAAATLTTADSAVPPAPEAHKATTPTIPAAISVTATPPGSQAAPTCATVPAASTVALVPAATTAVEITAAAAPEPCRGSFTALSSPPRAPFAPPTPRAVEPPDSPAAASTQETALRS
ncbi:hypothetical protein PLESTF_001787000 [Pleodorina starrii]|nr:hypothetical protein PLESTF_001787000 [Pleodorina starrii]